MSGVPTAGGATVLISFCNVASNPRPSSLLRFDIATRRGQWIDVGLGTELLASGVGITADDSTIYHISIRNSDFASAATSACLRASISASSIAFLAVMSRAMSRIPTMTP